MCGITGIIDLHQTMKTAERRETVARMNAALLHRGPDGAGAFDDDRVALAMRRLSIIDLHTGSQPLWNEGKDVGVFMNGEIYNYPELKKDLQEKGHVFYTHSDTEVLVHLYEEYGDEFMGQLRGMFAFCLYDRKRNRLLMARDRFGEKPFYYHQQNGVLSFSSEVASLLENKAISRRLDRAVLPYYLAAGYVPEPLTLLEGVRTLRPGYRLTIDPAGLQELCYFEVSFAHREKKLITDESEAVELIRPLLKQAVRRQLMSDVPVGAFLSGGIDSSTICALTQQAMDRPLDTFTVKFEEASYDESKIAAEVAARIGSNHHVIEVANREFSESIFWTIIDHVGLPFPDSSAIPVHLITQEISKHVKVALSGDGGDEIFAGYPVFGWWQKIANLTKLPQWSRQTALALAERGLFPISGEYNRKIARATRASLNGEKGISLGIHRLFFDGEMDELLREKIPDNYPVFTDAPDAFSTWTPLRKSMYHRVKHNLTTDMLIKVDRMSMANSLEVRAPFLDPDLHVASLRLADELLYKNGTGKRILRAVMRDELPASVFDHPKSGFSIPLHKYQNETYRKLSDELLGPSGPLQEILHQEAVQQICATAFGRTFAAGKTTAYRAAHQHWALLLLAGWMQRFGVQ